jgi:predicted MFS family arabinose efflux permease
MTRMTAPATSLRHEPLFVRWASAEGVSLVGSAVTTVVLPLVVYETTGSAAQTGVLYALRVVPYLVVGLIAGPIADRGNRRRLIIGGNLIEGVLVASIPVANAFGVLSVAQIYAVALLSATAFVFSDAAVFGAVPALVGPQRLAAANGLLSSVSSGAEVIGPVIAGGLVAIVGPATSVTIDAASFVVAAAVLASIPSTFRTTSSAPTRDVREGVAAALRFIRRRRDVATLLGVGFGNSFAFGAVLGLAVPYAVEVLGFASDDGRIGFLFAASGVGSLVSGLLFARVFRTGRVPMLTPLTLLVSGAFALVLARTTSWPVALVLFAMFSLSMTTTITIGITYRQLAAPDDLRSSINVMGRMISWGGQPFGAAAGALVASLASVPTSYTMAAVVMVVSAVVARILLRREPMVGAHR